MTRSSYPAAALIALALASCSQRSPDGNFAIDHDAASPTANSVLPPDPATQPDARTMQAENAAAAATGSDGPMMDQIKPIPGHAAGLIPPPFQGRWGMVPGDCTSTRGDAKGLMTVGRDKIRFYESTAILKSVATDDPVHFVGNFDFAGEGQTWKRSEDMKLADGGKTLARTDDESSAKYRRCA